uniref:Uncharacterized protein n=1 Tax=Arundo donax TaxID=35708 RepID=A0A0A9FT12_ARUDO
MLRSWRSNMCLVEVILHRAVIFLSCVGTWSLVRLATDGWIHSLSRGSVLL